MKYAKKILMFLIVAVMAVGLFAGCTNETAPVAEAPVAEEPAAEAPAEEEPASEPAAEVPADSEVYDDIEATIGITFQDLSNEFVANKKKYIVNYVATHYPNITLLTLDGAGDAANQVTQMENFINQGVDCIICNPQESTALQPSYEAAIAAGIPVVSDGTDIDEEVGQVYSSCPDIPGAEKQVEYMMSLFGADETIDVAIMRGVIGHQAEILRSTGYENVMSANPGRCNIVFDQTANYSREEGMALMENWLSSGKNINAVLCQNDEMALGATEAIKAAGLTDKIYVFGIDGIEDAIYGVQDGTLTATMYQNGAGIIQNAFDLALKFIKGESVADIAIDQELVTSENVDQYVEKILYLAELPA